MTDTQAHNPETPTKRKQKPRSQMRPRSSLSRRHEKTIRFSDLEWSQVLEAAALAGLTTSAYIRARALGAPLVAKQKLVWSSRLIGKMGKIANNLNQIKGHAVTLANADAHDEAARLVVEIAVMSREMLAGDIAPPLDGGNVFFDPLDEAGKPINTATRRMNSSGPNEGLLGRATDFFPSLQRILKDIKDAGRV